MNVLDKLSPYFSRTAQPILFWWQQRAQKERYYLIIGGFFVGLFLINNIVVSPLSEHINALQLRVHQQQTLLKWMKPRAALLKGKKTTSHRRVTRDNLLATVDQTVKRSSLAVYLIQINQTSGKQVQLRFKQVPFDSLLKWLVTQWQAYGIHVTSLRAKRNTTKSGLADVILVLKG